ncbi:MAG: GAF domain-containing sensor histidine kinase [Armatimonadetes bacterium]|nr:GAF domain-containing sensor histidine kinase [Armatimonadota bacterium]
MIETGILEIGPPMQALIARVVGVLKQSSPEIVAHWSDRYRGFVQRNLAGSGQGLLPCNEQEFELIIGSLDDGDFEGYYRRMAAAGQRFSAQGVSYESLTAWIHLLEDSYLPFLYSACRDRDEFSEVLTSLDTLVHNDFAIIASAYFEAREQEILQRNRQLSRLNYQLSVIHTITNAMTSTLQLEEVLRIVLEECLHYLQAHRGVLLLAEAAPGGDDLYHPLILKAAREGESVRSIPDRIVLQALPQIDTPALVTSSGPLCHEMALWDDPVASCIAAPLKVGDRTIGSLCVGNLAEARAFGEEDLDFLHAVARQAAIAIENARLYQAEKTARQEIEAAREMQNRLLMRLITAQEDERRRVAMEIHDGPTQSISAVLMSLQTLREIASRDPEAALGRLEQIESTVRDNVTEMRRLINDLRPAGLDDIGFVAAAKQYVREFSQATGIRAEVGICGPERPLESQLATMCFRILQEALTNVRRHAGADSVRVVMRFEEDRFSLEVSDDGRGFDTSRQGRPPDRLHFGLMGMQERAELSGGKLTIRSDPGQGTHIRASVPI